MPEAHDLEVRIFFANTRFEQMARRPGGVPREQAVAQAQAKISELKSGFSDWLESELQGLTAAVSIFESDPGDESSLERAYGNALQLEAVCAPMGYELVTFVAGNLCTIFATFKNGSPYDKGIVDCHINAFLLAKADQYRHLAPEDVSEMTKGLRQVVELAGKNSTPNSVPADA
jgi:hypothetical protein